MKKALKAFSLVLFIIISTYAFAACSKAQPPQNVPRPAPKVVTLSKRDAPLSIAELSKNSDIIVLATILDEKLEGDGYSLYTVAADQEVRGKYPENVKIYANSNRLEKGRQYLLFLELRDSVFWKMPLLVFVDTDAVAMVEDGVIVSRDLIDGMTGKKVKDCIKTLKNAKHKAAPIDTFPLELSKEELVAVSDNIFIGKVSSVQHFSSVSAELADITIEKNIVASSDNFIKSAMVPRGLKDGKSYLFFRSEGMARMPARNGCILEVGTKQYEEMMAFISPDNNDVLAYSATAKKDIKIFKLPDTASRAIQKLKKKEPIKVRPFNAEWVEVIGKGEKLYIQTNSLIIPDKAKLIENTAQTEPAIELPQNGTAIISYDANVYSGAGSRHKKLGALKAGAEVNILDRTGFWIKISWKDTDKEAYVHASYIL